MKKAFQVAFMVVLGGLSVGLLACGENQAATAKCKEVVKDAEGCSKCCTEHGASGNTYSGSGCTCRGGS